MNHWIHACSLLLSLVLLNSCSTPNATTPQVAKFYNPTFPRFYGCVSDTPSASY